MKRRRRQSLPHAPLDAASIAIVGCGLSGLSTALSLESVGFQNITIYERDVSFSARREGYGLTLKYDPKGILQKLGVLEEIARRDCPSRSHYLLDSKGFVLGYFGNAFSAEDRGFGQRGNLRVPRQTLRWVLLERLQHTKIQWNHKLTGLRLVDSKMEVTFEGGNVAVVDWVIGADGYRSATLESMLPTAAPPTFMGVRLILGLTDHCTCPHSLIDERGFYTLAPGHRLFVMPYTRNSAVEPSEPTRYMWQLSFATKDESGDETAGIDLHDWWQDAYDRCGHWHRPIAELLQSTPRHAVWSSLLYDQDGEFLQQSFLQLLNQQVTNRVVIVGDAMHAMSCFKGQGAHQALLDGPCVARWLHQWALSKVSTVAALKGCWRELVQRTAPIVKASRQAAHELHSPTVLADLHPVAGVDPDDAHRLLKILRDTNVCVDTVANMDDTIRSVIDDHFATNRNIGRPTTPPSEWTEALWAAASNSDLARLRVLSWTARDSRWIQDANREGTTILHAAASSSHSDAGRTVEWLTCEALCDCHVKDDKGRTANDVTTNAAVKTVLNRLELGGRELKGGS